MQQVMLKYMKIERWLKSPRGVTAM